MKGLPKTNGALSPSLFSITRKFCLIWHSPIPHSSYNKINILLSAIEKSKDGYISDFLDARLCNEKSKDGYNLKLHQKQYEKRKIKLLLQVHELYQLLAA